MTLHTEEEASKKICSVGCVDTAYYNYPEIEFTFQGEEYTGPPCIGQLCALWVWGENEEDKWPQKDRKGHCSLARKS